MVACKVCVCVCELWVIKWSRVTKLFDRRSPGEPKMAPLWHLLNNIVCMHYLLVVCTMYKSNWNNATLSLFLCVCVNDVVLETYFVGVFRVCVISFLCLTNPNEFVYTDLRNYALRCVTKRKTWQIRFIHTLANCLLSFSSKNVHAPIVGFYV